MCARWKIHACELAGCGGGDRGCEGVALMLPVLLVCVEMDLILPVHAWGCNGRNIDGGVGGGSGGCDPRGGCDSRGGCDPSAN